MFAVFLFSLIFALLLLEFPSEPTNGDSTNPPKIATYIVDTNSYGSGEIDWKAYCRREVAPIVRYTRPRYHNCTEPVVNAILISPATKPIETKFEPTVEGIGESCPIQPGVISIPKRLQPKAKHELEPPHAFRAHFTELALLQNPHVREAVNYDWDERGYNLEGDFEYWEESLSDSNSGYYCLEYDRIFDFKIDRRAQLLEELETPIRIAPKSPADVATPTPEPIVEPTPKSTKSKKSTSPKATVPTLSIPLILLEECQRWNALKNAKGGESDERELLGERLFAALKNQYPTATKADLIKAMKVVGTGEVTPTKKRAGRPKKVA